MESLLLRSQRLDKTGPVQRYQPISRKDRLQPSASLPGCDRAPQRRQVHLLGRKREMPGSIKLQLTTLKAQPPRNDQWLHEIKYDGYRVQIHINKGKR
jgi:ATP-dependent DNA ligase